jgi:hypothetical protein
MPPHPPSPTLMLSCREWLGIHPEPDTVVVVPTGPELGWQAIVPAGVACAGGDDGDVVGFRPWIGVGDSEGAAPANPGLPGQSEGGIVQPAMAPT